MIDIPQKRIEFINKEAYRILGEMEDLPNPKPSTSILKGSAKEKDVLDWTDKVIDAPVRTSSIIITGEKVDWKECYKERCYGFNEELFKSFQKLIKTIEKDQTISSKISTEFLETICFDWFVNTYKNQQAKNDLSSHILEEINESIKEYIIHYPILYLDIEGFIDVGKTKLGYFTKEYLEKLERNFIKRNPSKKENNPYEYVRKELQGEVLIILKVKAEIQKAKQIALEECSLAIDVLKLCSITTDIPNYKLSFDIDSRTSQNLKNRVIHTIPAKPDEFIFSIYRIPKLYKIDKAEWKEMKQKQLRDFHEFLLNKGKYNSELKRLIVNSIRRYSAAISKDDLNQRIVELFTILESLLLKDENVPIVESLCKYGSKLVFKKIEDRKHFIKLTQKMYSIRSAYIHHGVNKKIDLGDLRQLQYITLMLMTQLIKRLEKYKTKLSILQEIDDEILKAY